MLTEQRYEMILNLLEENKSVTVTQIKELLHISARKPPSYLLDRRNGL